MEDYNQIEASKCLEKSGTLLLLLFQISVTLVSDTETLVSDIYQLRFRYHKKLQPLLFTPPTVNICNIISMSCRDDITINRSPYS